MVKTLLQKLKRKIDKHDIISFDIFDTLVVRPYMHPNDMFSHIGQIEKIPDFQKIRIDAFFSAVNKYCKDGNQEVTLDQIYEFVPKQYRYIKDTEQEFEYNFIIPNKEMHEVYEYALKSGKRVIIISDMYLPIDLIKKILHKNGYDGYYKLYLSSQIKKLKFTGDLYRFAIDDLKVDPDEILHIGDTMDSDINAAKRVGIDTYFYEKIRDKLLSQSQHITNFYNAHRNDLTTSIMFGLMALYNHENPKDDYWHNLGLKYGGPFVYSYMQWLSNEVKKDEIHELLFVARDGYTLEKVFNIIQNKNQKIKTHYFYAPRELMLMCTLDLYSRNKNQKEMIDATRSITEYYKSETDAKDIKIPNLETLQDCEKFFSDNLKMYQELAKKEKDKYEQYLYTKIPKNCDRCAIVDLGTVFFTAHSLLSEIFKNKLFFKGYYFWANNNFKKEYNYSFITEIPYHIEFVELLGTSPEPPIKTLKNNEPIYKPQTDFEKIRSKIYPDISNGILDFSKLLKKIFGDTPINFNNNVILDYINTFQFNLQKTDYKYFNKVYCSVDVAHKNYNPIFPPNSKSFGLLSKNINGGIEKTVFLFGLPIYKYFNSNYEKYIKLCSTDIYHKWKFGHKHNKRLILGGVISYKTYNAFTYDFRFCGLRIMRHVLTDGILTSTFCGIKYQKSKLKDLLLDRILQSVDSKYDDIYICRYNIGESYIYLSHFQDCLKNNKSKNPVVVIFRQHYLPLYKMFIPKNIDIKYINLSDFDVYRTLDKSVETRNGKRIFCTTPYIALNMKKLYKNHKDTNFYKYICKDIGRVGEMQKPLLTNKTDKSIKKPFILICPEATSLRQMPYNFWYSLITKLQEYGYNIVINSLNDFFKIQDVQIINCDIQELCEIANDANGIISMGSGLAVLLTSLNKPMDLLYTNWTDDLLTSKETIDLYSVLYLPNVDDKKVKEYDAEKHSPDVLLNKILKRYEK